VTPDAAAEKRAAAGAALELVQRGMKLGLGTGSTAAEFVRLLAGRVRDGLDVIAVATSEATAGLARSSGIALGDLDDLAPLDLTVDGADEIGPGLALIKGGGGALLREKIVACASERMVVIADGSKLVGRLGAFALPVEIVRFAPATTMKAIDNALSGAGIGAGLRLRETEAGAIFVSDGNNLIVECACGAIDDPARAAAALSAVTGVVEHGLFVGVAARAAVGLADGGVRWIERG